MPKDRKDLRGNTQFCNKECHDARWIIFLLSARFFCIITHVYNNSGKIAAAIPISQIRKLRLKVTSLIGGREGIHCRSFWLYLWTLCAIEAYRTPGNKAPMPTCWMTMKHSISLSSSVDSRNQKRKTWWEKEK